MLRQASSLCKSVFSMDPLLDATTSSVHVQYAACSIVKAFTANVRGMALAQAQQQRQVAAAAQQALGSEGIVIHESAVQVSFPSDRASQKGLGALVLAATSSQRLASNVVHPCSCSCAGSRLGWQGLGIGGGVP